VQAVLFEQNFEDLALGSKPGTSGVGGFTTVRPDLNDVTQLIEVVEFAGGKGLRMYDNNATTTGNNTRAALEKNFGTSAAGYQAVELRFTAKLLPVPAGVTASSTSGLIIGMGAFNSSTGVALTGNERVVDFRLQQNGQYGVARNVSGTSTTTLSGSSNVLSYGADGISFRVVANAGPTSVNYTGPDGNVYALGAKRFSAWIGNSLVELSSLTQFEFRATTTVNELGRFAIYTGSGAGDAGINFLIDDIQLSVIPEPATWALALGVAAGLAVALRRRVQR
jgi:hypothetical protein